MNTSAVKSSFYEDLKRVSSKVDEWPEWKRHSLRSALNESGRSQYDNQIRKSPNKTDS